MVSCAGVTGEGGWARIPHAPRILLCGPGCKVTRAFPVFVSLLSRFQWEIAPCSAPQRQAGGHFGGGDLNRKPVREIAKSEMRTVSKREMACRVSLCVCFCVCVSVFISVCVS